MPFITTSLFAHSVTVSDTTMSSLQVVPVKNEDFDAETVPGILPATQESGVPALNGRYTTIAGPVNPDAQDNCALIMAWICDNFGGPAQFLRAQLPDKAVVSSPLISGGMWYPHFLDICISIYPAFLGPHTDSQGSIF